MSLAGVGRAAVGPIVAIPLVMVWVSPKVPGQLSGVTALVDFPSALSVACRVHVGNPASPSPVRTIVRLPWPSSVMTSVFVDVFMVVFAVGIE